MDLMRERKPPTQARPEAMYACSTGIFADLRMQTLLDLCKDITDVCVENLYVQAERDARAGGKTARETYAELIGKVLDWGYEKQRGFASSVLEKHGAKLGDLYLAAIEIYVTQVLTKSRESRGSKIVRGVPTFDAFLHHLLSRLLNSIEVRNSRYHELGPLDKKELVAMALRGTLYDFLPHLSIEKAPDAPDAAEEAPRRNPVDDFFSPRDRYQKPPSARSLENAATARGLGNADPHAYVPSISVLGKKKAPPSAAVGNATAPNAAIEPTAAHRSASRLASAGPLRPPPQTPPLEKPSADASPGGAASRPSRIADPVRSGTSVGNPLPATTTPRRESQQPREEIAKIPSSAPKKTPSIVPCSPLPAAVRASQQGATGSKITTPLNTQNTATEDAHKAPTPRDASACFALATRDVVVVCETEGAVAGSKGFPHQNPQGPAKEVSNPPALTAGTTVVLGANHE